VIVDDDSSMQEALRKSLARKPQFFLFEIYPDYPGCFNVLKRSPPDTVLLANSIGGISGQHWLRKLNRAIPEVPIVLLAQSATPETVLEAILAGARGFLVKPVSPRNLLRAIARCLEGWPIFCRQAQGALLAALRPRGGSRRFRLTPREQEVLTLLFRGRSDKEISAALGVGTGTVHSYLAHIYKKLGAHSRRQAVARFFRQKPAGDASLCE